MVVKEKNIEEVVELNGDHTLELHTLLGRFRDSKDKEVNSSNVGRLSCELIDAYKPPYVKALDYIADVLNLNNSKRSMYN